MRMAERQGLRFREPVNPEKCGANFRHANNLGVSGFLSSRAEINRERGQYEIRLVPSKLRKKVRDACREPADRGANYILGSNRQLGD